MNTNDIVIGMVGSGGDGVVAVGDILATVAASEGLNCLQLKSFGPQIRGGESSCIIRVSGQQVNSQGSVLNVLVAFNWNDFTKFPGELNVADGVMVICDENNFPEKLPFPEGVKTGEIFKIPFDKLVRESQNPKAKNIIALGLITEIFNLPAGGLKKSIERKFGRKKPEILESNIRAIDIGINYAKDNKLKSGLQFQYNKGPAKLVATGNDALAYGALTAGCRFFASYPITPASEIMEWMGKELPKFGGTMVQAEDEISAVCMVTGASFGGVKAMTATSGPGVSLKIEAIGLGTIAELPYVVVNVQRGGPATGIPTKAEQADLMQAVYGMHGDAPHAVLAATDVEDCFDVAIQAFNTAEAYQMPVIILSDQFIGHRKETVDKFDTKKFKIIDRDTPKKPTKESYKRFVDTDTGVSPMSYPGIKGGEYICSGIEHNEDGHPVSNHIIHEQMSAKRARKLDHLAKNYPFIRIYGSSNPDVGIITWGSTKGVVKEAVMLAEKEGLKVGACIPQLIYPLQADKINDFITSCKKIMVVEMSHSGQFAKYLSSYSKMPEKFIHFKTSGAMFFAPDDVLKELKRGL